MTDLIVAALRSLHGSALLRQAWQRRIAASAPRTGTAPAAPAAPVLPARTTE